MSADLNRSAAHEAYIRKQQRRNRRIRLTQWGLLVLFLLFWEISARIGWVDAFIMSSPSRIGATLWSLTRSGELFGHAGITVMETVAGFLLGTLLGVGLAMILWWWESAARVLEPYLVVINSLPKIALGPVLIVWLGAGYKPIIAVAVLISVVVTTMTVLEGFTSTSRDKMLLLRAFGATRRQVFSMVVLPANLPVIISAVKINVGMAWVGVIVGEFLVSRAGLGYLIVYGGQVMRMDLVMASTAVLCVAAALMYALVAMLEKRMLARIGRG